MTPERWQQLKQIFQSALERNPAERSAFLNQACAGDPALRSEVESLLSSHDQAGDSIEAMAAEAATEMLAGDRAIVGKQVGHYKVLNRIGRGGMGEVFLAQDTSLGRRVALKLLRTEFTRNEERLRRFRQEARAASNLNHPNILTIYEIGSEGSTYFMATEYVEGETLRQRLASARMKLGEALDVAIQVAGALAAAHQAGIVHRDIKPENIMVRRDGYAKVLDFGLAKLTERAPPSSDSAWPTLGKVETNPGIVMGTVQYMSPEQARGLEVDPRTDIFSLGVVVYEMLSGRAPFEGGTTSDVIVSLLDKEPVPLSRYSPDVPAELQRIVGKSLCKNKEGRYQAVKDLLIDLKSLRDELAFEAKLKRSVPPEVTSGAVASGTGERTVRTATAEAAHPTSSAGFIITAIKRHKRVAAVVLAVLAVAAAVSVFIYSRRDSRRAVALTEKDAILLADIVNTTRDPVFDGTLKQALAIQLEQSPFLNIFPDERVRETLRLMSRSADERVTKDVAREICQRQGLKAYLVGSIANLGSRLVITLEAVNAQTGDTLAREQSEAESKEQVFKTLGGAATKLREKLGESLASIQKFDVPIEQATTSSLEAFKAFSLGVEQSTRGKGLVVTPFYKRAIELDPNFALAYSRLAVAYRNTAQGELAAEFSQKAFELRERVSEREKFYISADYYTSVTRELDKQIEVFELWKRTYPRDYEPLNSLALRYLVLGQHEKAIEEARESIRLNPNFAAAYLNLGLAFRRLNRFEEAKEVFERALEQKLDATPIRSELYTIAFVQGDTAAMRQQIDSMSGRPDEYVAQGWQAGAAAFSGQSRKAREFSSRAIDLAERRNLKEAAAVHAAAGALKDAVFDTCRQAKKETAKALAILRTRDSLRIGALALALCGEANKAQSLIDELSKRYPKDTLLNAVWLPSVRAAIEIHHSNPGQAVELLQAAGRYEMGTQTSLWPVYIRGLAYLRQRAGAEAAAEFQKILDHKGAVLFSGQTSVSSFSLYPSAHLGLARAAALAGDTAKSRKAYEDFFALWKDADPDIPILQEARQEYDRLKREPG